MPFTTTQFFGIFREYNEAVWPLQIVLIALALVALGLLRRPSAGRLVSALLAVLWAWMAIAYHFVFFTRINPAAWIFGALFLVQALLFLWMGPRLRFGVTSGARSWTGGLLLLYAMVVYPLLGALSGHVYLESPTFGLPCPTTIFTFGLLFFLREPFPRRILVVPLLWAGIGSSAAFQLGVPQDLGLLAAGLAGLALAFAPRLGGDAPTPAKLPQRS